MTASQPLQPWNTIHRQTILHTGDFLTVEMHHIQLPDGRILTDWPWVITPDFTNMLVEDLDGNFPIFRQTKYAAGGETLALPGGYLEPGEDPLAAAQRELREEMGLEALEWIALGAYAIDGNRGCGVGHLFLARKARPAVEVNADDLEEQHVLTLTRAELRAALLDGQFKIVPWSAAAALGLLRLESE
jgi:ADP-ribose pyrophosphatase